MVADPVLEMRPEDGLDGIVTTVHRQPRTQLTCFHKISASTMFAAFVLRPVNMHEARNADLLENSLESLLGPHQMIQLLPGSHMAQAGGTARKMELHDHSLDVLQFDRAPNVGQNHKILTQHEANQTEEQGGDVQHTLGPIRPFKQHLGKNRRQRTKRRSRRQQQGATTVQRNHMIANLAALTRNQTAQVGTPIMRLISIRTRQRNHPVLEIQSLLAHFLQNTFLSQVSDQFQIFLTHLGH